MLDRASPKTESSEPRTPLWDRTLGWFLLLFFLWNVGMGVFSPLLPKVMEDLHLSFAAAGLLGTAFAVTRFLVDIPAGILADRLGISWLLHGAAALLLGGSILAAVAGSFESMAMARGLTGIGSGLANIISLLYLMRCGSAAHRNRRANLYELAVIAGMAISADAAGVIATHWDWRTSFGLAAGMLAAVWIVGAVGVLPGVRGILEDTPSERGPAKRTGTPAWRGTIVAVFVASFAQAFAWGGGISTLLPLYGGSALHLSPAVIGRAMAIAFWVEVCLLYPVGWAADTFGKARVMVPGFAAMLLGTLLVPWATGAVSYGAAFIVVAAGMSVWMTVPALMAESMAGAFGGKAAGLYRLVTDFGFIIGPAIVGWLIGRFGFAAAAASIAAVLLVSIVLSLVFLSRRRQ
jgi:MFS transporter, DHA1 family, multidrug resistance protein